MSPDPGVHQGATDCSQLPVLFARAFNAGNLEAADKLFEPDAVRVLRPGEVVTGDDRRAATRRFLDLGIPIRLSVRHAYVHGDLALLICDHLIEGTRPDGQAVRIEGTATDVVRRGADGLWRYAIDNPPGTDREPAVA